MRDVAVTALFLAGLAVVCAGVWLIYPPAGVIAAGVALILLAVGMARMGGAVKHESS